jgi:hypothetical protein
VQTHVSLADMHMLMHMHMHRARCARGELTARKQLDACKRSIQTLKQLTCCLCLHRGALPGPRGCGCIEVCVTCERQSLETSYVLLKYSQYFVPAVSLSLACAWTQVERQLVWICLLPLECFIP